MKSIDIYKIKQAIKYGQIEIFVQKGYIYANDCQSGECVKLGTVKGESVDEKES